MSGSDHEREPLADDELRFPVDYVDVGIDADGDIGVVAHGTSSDTDVSAEADLDRPASAVLKERDERRAAPDAELSTSRRGFRDRPWEAIGAMAGIVSVLLALAFFLIPKLTQSDPTEVHYWSSSAFDPNTSPSFTEEFEEYGATTYCQGPSFVSDREDLVTCMAFDVSMGMVLDPCMRISDIETDGRSTFACGQPTDGATSAMFLSSEDLEPVDRGSITMVPPDVPWLIRFGDRVCKASPPDDGAPWKNHFSCPAQPFWFPTNPEAWRVKGGVLDALKTDPDFASVRLGGALTRFEQLHPDLVEPGRRDVAGIVVDVHDRGDGVYEGSFSLDGSGFERVTIDEVWF